MATYTSPQDGTTADTRIAENAATTNYSTGTVIYVGESNAAAALSRSLLQFPGLTNGTVPSDATITSVSLFLKISGENSSNARTFRVYRSKRDVNISQCTWNIWKTGSNWATAGGFNADDCEQTDIGTCEFGASDTGWKEFPLTPSAIQAIVNGSWSTPTLFIKCDTESSDQYIFVSSEGETGTDRPYIVVNYTASAGGSPIFFDQE